MHVGAGGLRKWDGRGSGRGSTGRGEAPTERCVGVGGDMAEGAVSGVGSAEAGVR